MTYPFVKCTMQVAIEDDMDTYAVERLEDMLAVLLECMGLHGEIESEATGNTTVFPNPDNHGGDEAWLDKMWRRWLKRARPDEE